MNRARAESIIDELLADVPKTGLKGAATRIFREFGMFPKDVLFLSGDTCKTGIARELAESPISGGPLTVRFSCKKELGLPTGFFKDWHEAVYFIEQRCQPSWFCIVHKYIDLEHSFRLYIDEDKKIVEHIPGMWDSDNRSSPDIIILQQGWAYLYRYLEARSVKLVRDWETVWQQHPPVEFGEMKLWLSYLRQYDSVLQLLTQRFRPFVCYFVIDVEGVPYFLNMYVTRLVTTPERQVGHLHVVQSLADMRTWDGRKSILLRVTAERGRLDEIYLLAHKLAGTTALVYADFGVLSHPAIVLREYGVNVIPFFLSHEKLVLKEEES